MKTNQNKSIQRKRLSLQSETLGHLSADILDKVCGGAGDADVANRQVPTAADHSCNVACGAW